MSWIKGQQHHISSIKQMKKSVQDVVFERPEEDMENTWKVRGPKIEIEEVKEEEEQSIGTIEVD